MTDLQETPAVPPVDEGGDDRLGYFVAGGVLVALGWGIAVMLNLLLHSEAGPGGLLLGQARMNATLGVYAEATLGFGLFTGLAGAILLYWGGVSPRGRFVLPGPAYPWPGDGSATESPAVGTGASGHP